MRRDRDPQTIAATFDAGRHLWPMLAAAAVLALAVMGSAPLAAAWSQDCAAPSYRSGGATLRVAGGDSLLLATDGASVLASTDRGCTFSPIFDTGLDATDRDGAAVTDVAAVRGLAHLLVTSDSAVSVLAADAAGGWEFRDVTGTGCAAGCRLSAAADELYLAGDDLLHSGDGGLTWARVDLPEDAGRVTAVAGDGTSLWVATEHALLRRDTAGFEVAASLDGPVRSLAIVGDPPEVLGASDDGLVRLHPADGADLPAIDAMGLVSTGGSLLVLTATGLEWVSLPDAETHQMLPDRAPVDSAELPGDPARAPVADEATIERPVPDLVAVDEAVDEPIADVVVVAEAVTEVAGGVATGTPEVLRASLPEAGIRIGVWADDDSAEVVEETPADPDPEPVEASTAPAPAPPLPQRPDGGPAPAAEKQSVPAGSHGVEVTRSASTSAPWLATTAQLTGAVGAAALLALLVLAVAPRLSPSCAGALGLRRDRRRS